MTDLGLFIPLLEKCNIDFAFFRKKNDGVSILFVSLQRYFYYIIYLPNKKSKYFMDNQETVSLCGNKLTREHFDANKVYFAPEVLTDKGVMPIYSKLCMVLDIYDVKHEVMDKENSACYKAIKPAWLHEGEFNMADHIENHVRYLSDNRVLMTNCAEYDAEMANTLKRELETDGMEVVELSFSTYTAPRATNDMSWAYINYIQTSKVIIVPLQHTAEDKEALKQIKACFPNHAVVGVYAEPYFSNEGKFYSYSRSIKENSLS